MKHLLRYATSAHLTAIALITSAVVAASPLSAATITIMSDGTTLSAASFGDLNSASTATGLTFVPATVGGFGTFTPLPSGSPFGAQIINITPPGGQQGFFQTTFTLPVGFSGASIFGRANADDLGRAFLNGTPLSPVLGASGSISEFGDVSFSSANNSLFLAGLNTFLLSDLNSGGGPSGAGFWADITFTEAVATPVPAALPLFATGLAGLGWLARRRRKQAA